jgi:hypothetical protein
MVFSLEHDIKVTRIYCQLKQYLLLTRYESSAMNRQQHYNNTGNTAAKYLRTCLSGKDAEWFNSTASPKKWRENFIHFNKNNVPHANMKKVFGLIMCLPGSNAFVERVCSHVEMEMFGNSCELHME